MIDVDAFGRDGYLRIDGGAVREAARAAQSLLWQRIGLPPDRPEQWTQPVVWTSDYSGAGPFRELTGHPGLSAALDAVLGAGRWVPRGSLGNIVIRFPLPSDIDDRGWHIDLNTPLPDGSWAVSRQPHTVLLLTLLSEVGPDDAPTRIRVGSHRDVPRVLGNEPLDAVTAGRRAEAASAQRPVAHATGRPGDMYLLHPFTVHAADRHCGHTPRFMAQAPIMLTRPLTSP
ncbi:mitomycin antibiotics/polyketide fumonisin biosynthesis protein [Mycolicibacterium canariasense]|uniref:Mitomycin antibiotics/polyketide fumonisin biosynthesis protein n=1 Tax=Mycolicibacterium canariasense TaxID=228230 RepID=A0A124E1K0_MYCCR|nr:phytanoyl-CoA dioxygenase family protein [Mycolicibacterium canariasense]MCV7213220.1 phytanoyl-CoA dioxygenase family protein [Mycolicibacterium canariasense]ORV19352.1 mitomycin antibiotics/polyketide fumonisin biosynthesis protein [Mycolicibacterium canariasense]GAS93948.1 mitomycin antibiotics/polyketide fumonisin biosynthesis protein [Mycolicibacterium canariasense]